MPRNLSSGSSFTRTFIAIEMPQTVKEIISAHIRRLKDLVPTGAKWVGPRTAHLTLAFLGDVLDDRLSVLPRVLETVAAKSPPFKLATGHLGAFPTIRNPRVLWLGMDGDTQSLSRTQLHLQDAFEEEGFPRETHAFKPHITIGRARGKGSIHLPEGALDFPYGVGVEFEVCEIVLKSSVLTPRGPNHTRLHIARLSAA